MSTKAQDNVACIVAILIFAAFLVLTSQLVSFRARLVPMPIAAVSIALLLIQLYFQNFRPDVKLSVEGTDLFQIRPDVAEEEVETSTAVRQSRQNAHSELSAFAVVFALFLMVVLLGLLEAVFLFVLGYFILFGKERPHVALIWSAASTAILYVLFIRITNIHPWDGWIRLTFFPS